MCHITIKANEFSETSYFNTPHNMYIINILIMVNKWKIQFQIFKVNVFITVFWKERLAFRNEISYYNEYIRIYAWGRNVISPLEVRTAMVSPSFAYLHNIILQTNARACVCVRVCTMCRVLHVSTSSLVLLKSALTHVYIRFCVPKYLYVPARCTYVDVYI